MNIFKSLNVDIYAQPVFSFYTFSRNYNYFEILSRFYDKNNKLIMPEDIYSKYSFFENEFFYSLDKKIFNKLVKIISNSSININNSFNKNYTFAVNLSEPTLLNYNYYFNYLDYLLYEHNLIPNNFNLEITEKSFNNLESFIRKALKRGYSISIDDFGSGNISQGRLRKEVLPVFIKEKKLSYLTLKIDNDIIKNLDKEYKEKEIDLSFIDFVFSIKKTYPEINLVAEGIENQNIFYTLIKKSYEKGVLLDYGQGFYFGKSKKLENYLEEY